MRTILGLLIYLALQPAPCVASVNHQAEEYLRVRARAQVVTSFSDEQITNQPELFAGKLLEVRGTITAVAGSSSQSSLLIATPFSGSTTMVLLPPDKRLMDWPFLDVGIGVRLLCQIVMVGGSSTGTLELTVPVKEYDAQFAEQARTKATAAKLAAIVSRQQQKPAKRKSVRSTSKGSRQNSRYRYSDAQLVEIYGNAVRYFNRHVSEGDAQKIAAHVINESRRAGLDARLLLTILEAEGTLRNKSVLRTLGSKMSTVYQVANALSRQIKSNRSGKSLMAGLANRRRAIAGGKPVSTAIVEGYVNQVMTLYRQMTGLDEGQFEWFEEQPAPISPAELVRTSGKYVVSIKTLNVDGSESHGTGFVCPGGGGNLLLTCEHLISKARKIIVTSLDSPAGTEAEVRGSDTTRDIAILQASRRLVWHASRWTRQSVRLGDSKATIVGSRVYVIGNPKGLEHTISEGLLSARRSIDGLTQLQISAPISPGSSGSPLFNEKGEVIGMVQAQIIDGQNLNFAIAIHECTGKLLEVSELIQ